MEEDESIQRLLKLISQQNSQISELSSLVTKLLSKVEHLESTKIFWN